MNRVIKFRVWDKKRNKFVKEAFTGGFDSAEIKMTLNGKLTWECEYGDGVVDGIIQQFTGLVDKNNREIYEGDIVEIQYWPEDAQNSNIKTDKIGIIEFNTQYSCYYCVGKTEDGLTTHSSLYSKPGENRLKIIGNICQNPRSN